MKVALSRYTILTGKKELACLIACPPVQGQVTPGLPYKKAVWPESQYGGGL